MLPLGSVKPSWVRDPETLVWQHPSWSVEKLSGRFLSAAFVFAFPLARGAIALVCFTLTTLVPALIRLPVAALTLLLFFLIGHDCSP
jgi:hypothetical protein